MSSQYPRTVRTIFKILMFVALVTLYYAFAGSAGWRTNFAIRIASIYEAGAIIAVWVGGRPIGTLQPVSLRPIFIALGLFLMLVSFTIMITTKDFVRRLERRSDNKPAAGLAHTVRPFTIKHHRSRPSEPGGWLGQLPPFADL